MPKLSIHDPCDEWISDTLERQSSSSLFQAESTRVFWGRQRGARSMVEYVTTFWSSKRSSSQRLASECADFDANLARIDKRWRGVPGENSSRNPRGPRGPRLSTLVRGRVCCLTTPTPPPQPPPTWGVWRPAAVGWRWRAPDDPLSFDHGRRFCPPRCFSPPSQEVSRARNLLATCDLVRTAGSAAARGQTRRDPPMGGGLRYIPALGTRECPEGCSQVCQARATHRLSVARAISHRIS